MERRERMRKQQEKDKKLKMKISIQGIFFVFNDYSPKIRG